MPQVRLTITPDTLTEVPESELPVLRAQGLLLDEPPAAPPPPPPAGGKKDDQKETE